MKAHESKLLIEGLLLTSLAQILDFYREFGLANLVNWSCKWLNDPLWPIPHLCVIK